MWARGVAVFLPVGRPWSPSVRACGPSDPSCRSKLLERVDEELRRGDDKSALSLVREAQGKPGGLRFFGVARQVPQRLYSLDELKLNGIDTSAFLSPVDVTLGAIERTLQFGAAATLISLWAFLKLTQLQILLVSLGVLSLWSLDLVYFNGGVANLVLDTIGHNVSRKYRNRVLQHEAGHFLVAYLLGVLPRGYSITSLDALINDGSLNVQAGTAFIDFEFLEEVNTGKLSAKTLNSYSCIALAGVSTEYILYGYAEGGQADITQLDGLLKSLGFSQKKTDSQVRWAVLNTVLMLRRHTTAREQLAEAMGSGMSVGYCIQVIESNIDDEEL